MFNHIMVGTNDIDQARSFYNAVIGSLGFTGEPVSNRADSGHARLFYFYKGGIFCVSEPINDEPASFANGGTIGFKCKSTEQVDAFHNSAVANSGKSIEEPPGYRQGKTLGKIYLAYVRDPDGNKLCAIYRPK